MAGRELISVIVPIYNVEKYLKKCVDSILRQTYVHLEVILVDDGSPDGCPQMCDEYALRDARVKVVHKRNGGLSDARNAGIDIAKGAYLAFVDSDDFIEKDMLEKLYYSLIKYQADFSLCGLYCVDESGKRIPEQENKEIESGCWSYQDFWNNYYKDYSMTCVVACNKLYRKELFENVRYRVGKLHEDEFAIHYLVKRSTRIATVSERLYGYLRRTDSITGVGFNEKKLDGIEALVERCQIMISEKEWNIAKKAFLGVLVGMQAGRQKIDAQDMACLKRYHVLKKRLRKVFYQIAGKDFALKPLLACMIYFINEKVYWWLLRRKRKDKGE